MKGKIVPILSYRPMKVYDGAELQLYSFTRHFAHVLRTTRRWVVGFTLRPRCTRGKSPMLATHWIEIWVISKAGVNVLEESTSVAPGGNRTLLSSSPKLSPYNSWIILVPFAKVPRQLSSLSLNAFDVCRHELVVFATHVKWYLQVLFI